MEENKKNIPEVNEAEITNDTTPEEVLAEQELSDVKSNDAEEKPKKKGKAKKIILIVLAILLVIIIALGFYFKNVLRLVTWDNITAAFNSWWYSEEDIEKQMKDNKAKMEKIAEEDPLIDIRGDLTAEEALAYKNNEITREEAIKIIKGETSLEEIREAKNKEAAKDEEDNESDEASEAEDGETVPKDKSEDKGDKEPAPETEKDRISQIVAELYVIQADFISKLEAIGDSAYADYKATYYDRSKIMTIVNSYTATVGDLEAECDRKVNALIKELKSELDKAGRDHSLAKEIQNYYYTEKSLKKSYYLNKLNDEDYK